MKVDLSKMTNEQAKEMARRFRKAPCIVCKEKSTGYRKLHLGEQAAFLPLCDECQNAPVSTLMKIMELADDGYTPNDKAVGNTFRNS